MEMTLTEIQEEIADFRKQGSHKAYCSLSITEDTINVIFYPDGLLESFSVLSTGVTAREAFDNIKIKWADVSERRNSQTVKKAALEIIRITHEFGECTDAALRCEVGIIAPELTDAAIETANKMADGGPFKVVSIAGANAA